MPADAARHPEKALVLLHITPGGARALRYSATDLLPSSELNSHVAVHADQITRRRADR